MNKYINDIEDLYDYRNPKFQNFSYNFKVVSVSSGLDREVEVWATSLLVATDRLRGELGDDFKITEL